jgi:hypothetical protein
MSLGQIISLFMKHSDFTINSFFILFLFMIVAFASDRRRDPLAPPHPCNHQK